MLARAGFGDDSPFAKPYGEQRLADAIVDLVRPGVIQIFALQIDLRTAQLRRPALGVIDRAGSPDVVLELTLELRQEVAILAITFVGVAQFIERMDQRFRDKHPAVIAEMPAGIGKISQLHCEPRG